jgi:hypothetical protein
MPRTLDPHTNSRPQFWDFGFLRELLLAISRPFDSDMDSCPHSQDLGLPCGLLFTFLEPFNFRPQCTRPWIHAQILACTCRTFWFSCRLLPPYPKPWTTTRTLTPTLKTLDSCADSRLHFQNPLALTWTFAPLLRPSIPTMWWYLDFEAID